MEVLSSLHQRVKFIVGQQLISVMGEKELMISTHTLVEYIEGGEEALETTFQSLEIVGTTGAKMNQGLRRAKLGYDGTSAERRPDGRTQKAQKQGQIKPYLYQYFVSGGIILLEQVINLGGEEGKKEAGFDLTVVKEDEVESGIKNQRRSGKAMKCKVANIVPVPKKDWKVQMCVNYRDLNRASPKDNFPLPHINMLVDNTT
ncbi:hypothetical protein CR513_14911, partial [Mucuna pruriens]